MLLLQCSTRLQSLSPRCLTLKFISGKKNSWLKLSRLLPHNSDRPNGRRWKISSTEENINDNSRNQSPFLDDDMCPVPFSQQPINEYNNLLQSDFFTWVNLDLKSYSLRIALVCFVVSGLLGWPVASLTFNQKTELLKSIMASLAAGQAAATFAVIRLFLGWSFVGSRLFSATVEYEESGWYDGQVWVKTPELLMRDRLLATYKVKPVLKRLKQTLVGLAGSLLLSSVLLLVPLMQPFTQPAQEQFETPPVAAVPVYSLQAAELYEQFHAQALEFVARQR